jgi:Icc-related predicted phosphoesterase
MVRVHVVSDIHGRTDGLAEAGAGADVLLCLGDLIAFVDYEDPRGGIVGTLFGAAAVGRFVELRALRRHAEARAHIRALWDSLGDRREAIVGAAVHEQYAEVTTALSGSEAPVLVTYGNVDRPLLLREHIRAGTTLLDGAVMTVAGLTFGLVGGGLPGTIPSPAEIPVDAYDAKIDAVQGCDVLAAHVPPHLPGLVYDVRAGRFETGSTGLLRALHRWQPRALVFGHVHNPLVSELSIGSTALRNAGHFKATGRPTVLEL